MSRQGKMPSRKHSNRELPGIGFEQAVAAIQARLDPDASVEHNVTLRDRLGHERQFDVVIRGRAGGYSVLGVMECKDLQRKVGTPEIEAFAMKARNANANIVLMVSRKGFTKTALVLARDLGVGTLSLLRNDLRDHGVSVGWRVYGHQLFWNRLQVQVCLSDGRVGSLGDSFNHAKIAEQNVMDWLVWLLGARFGDAVEVGWHQFAISSQEPRSLAIAEESVEIVGLAVKAERVSRAKTKVLQWAGEGIVDWNSNQLHIPANGTLQTLLMKPDLSDWDDHEGEVPPLGAGGAFVDIRPLVMMGVPITNIDCDLQSLFSVEHSAPAA